MAAIPGHRVIVFLQENKTTDFYFPSLAAWGAIVANHGNLLAAAPNFDQPHDRNAWVHYAMGDYPALPVQLDNDRIIPFYSYLAKEFTFSDHHFGSGSNSTPGHMLAIGGQMPTMKNPPFFGPHPVWDLPSIFHHCRGRPRFVGCVSGPVRIPDEVLHQPHHRTRVRERVPTERLHPDGQSWNPSRRLLRLGSLRV